MAEAKANLSLKVGNNILTFRADTVAELEALIKEGEASPTLSGAFFDEKPAATVTGVGSHVGGITVTATAPSEVPTDEEALANVKEVLGATEDASGEGQEMASPALTKAAIAKSKKTATELGSLTKTEALRLIKEGK